MTGPIIQLSGIDKHFGPAHVLRGISVDIAPGEFFSLLGPSGCGKTTLLRTIAGFETPDSGTVRLGGADMAGVPPNRRPTNMVFQSYAIFPHLTVAQNVGFGLRRQGLAREALARKVEDALRMVNLSGLGGRAAHALSGGQRQRVALARALVLEPKVLLLDEPLSALDKKLREAMQLELRRLQRQIGITFVLVTHDQEEALVMSDRIAVMFDGEIAQCAPPAEVYGRPVSRRVAGFIGMMNFLPASFRADGPAIVAEIAGLGRARLDRAQAPGGMPPAAGEVGLRPETLTIESEPAAEGRSAEGVIADVEYYGDMTYYDVTLPGLPDPLIVAMKNLPGREVMPTGAVAHVKWDARALVAFGS